jgi:hypothetical protein
MITVPLLNFLFRKTVGVVGGFSIVVTKPSKKTYFAFVMHKLPEAVVIAPFIRRVEPYGFTDKFEVCLQLQIGSKSKFIGFYIKNFLPIFFTHNKTNE